VKTTTNSGVTIPIKALTANQSTACAVGDFVKFTGHSKVYLVVETVASNSSGEATITIEPPLRAAVTADESLVVQNVPFTMALSSDNLDGQLSSALRWGMDVELLEVI
jgi:hypothetical protein